MKQSISKGHYNHLWEREAVTYIKAVMNFAGIAATFMYLNCSEIYIHKTEPEWIGGYVESSAINSLKISFVDSCITTFNRIKKLTETNCSAVLNKQYMYFVHNGRRSIQHILTVYLY